jgi:hypothetical protein
LKSDETQKNHAGNPEGVEPIPPASWQEWDSPESNWNQAAMLTPQVDPFCCRTEWQLSYHEAMAPHRKLLVREVPGSVVALADQQPWDSGRMFGPVESSWSYGCPLLGPDSIELFDDLLGQFEARADGLSPRFWISGLVPNGKLIRELIEKLGSRYKFWQGPSETLCNASLEGGVDGYLARRSATHRRGLSTQARRVAKRGLTFERHVPKDSAEATQIYSRMLAVETDSWKGIEQCGMTVEPARAYYDCMLRRLAASGTGRVMFARHGERDIGYIFGGLAGNVYRGQQFSYVQDWKSFSVGNLLQVELIKWLCEENILRYDMGPVMDYKKHWTENNYPITTVVLQHKRAKSNRQRDLPF